MSCTMIVDIETSIEADTETDTGSGDPATKTGFLKMYDRRFAEGLRSNEGNFRANEMDWDDAQIEADLADMALKQYTAEIAVYDSLRDHQGTVVPRLCAAVDLDLTPPGVEDDELFHVKGLLLEYYESFPMLELSPDKAPQSAWQGIVDQGIAAAHVFGDHYILDRDCSPRNFFVFPDKNKNGEFRVLKVDFGCCRFKREDESKEEWASNKMADDEVSAVGAVMQKWLAADHGFQIHFEQTDRYFADGLEFSRALARADLERLDEWEKTKAKNAGTIIQEET
ncbi:hypothetical protein B0I37DRAFT_432147 [Chaetomium sp. MPI-CAGE-AT-0009]|nr:hypothetical protein B0I37DRAFT_432147 [Chaetomium sp. MPI-CAGE-AT-0009]